jgi:ketosteroid isomerase-like protein
MNYHKGENMSDNQWALARMLDEAAIRNTTARFADAAIRADYKGFASLWAEDGEWAVGKPFEARAKGVNDIVSMLRHLWDGKEFLVQFALPGAIEINGDDATARCVCHEAARGSGGVYYRNHGVFFDRLRRSDDGWVFTNRTYQYLWLDTSPWSPISAFTA